MSRKWIIYIYDWSGSVGHSFDNRKREKVRIGTAYSPEERGAMIENWSQKDGEQAWAEEVVE